MTADLESTTLHTLAGHLRRCSTLSTDREALHILFEAGHKLDHRAEELAREERTTQRQNAHLTRGEEKA